MVGNTVDWKDSKMEEININAEAFIQWLVSNDEDWLNFKESITANIIRGVNVDLDYLYNQLGYLPIWLVSNRKVLTLDELYLDNIQDVSKYKPNWDYNISGKTNKEKLRDKYENYMA